MTRISIFDRAVRLQVALRNTERTAEDSILLGYLSAWIHHETRKQAEVRAIEAKFNRVLGREVAHAVKKAKR